MKLCGCRHNDCYNARYDGTIPTCASAPLGTAGNLISGPDGVCVGFIPKSIPVKLVRRPDSLDIAIKLLRNGWRCPGELVSLDPMFAEECGISCAKQCDEVNEKKEIGCWRSALDATK